MKRPQCLILTTLTLRASIDTMFCDLADALRRIGIHTRVFADAPEAPNLPLLQALITDLRNYDGPRFIIDINAKSRLAGQDAAGRPIFIHDAWNIPRLSIFESNPVHHLKQLAELPRNLALTVIDASHLETLSAFAVPALAQQHLPHAGPPPLADVPPMAERPIDLLFIGNVKEPPALTDWLAALPCPATLKPAIAHVIDARWQGAAFGADAALGAALDRLGLPREPRRDLPLACAIEGYISSLKRIEMLRAIKTGRLAICGEIAARLPNAERITAIGAATFVTCLQLMEQAKLLINPTPFRHGAHERVFYGLSRGAYILSDFSSLLAPAAREGAGISFLPQDPAALDDLIATLLAAPLDERVAAGQHWYAGRHLWDHRARQIRDLMMPLLDSEREPSVALRAA